MSNLSHGVILVYQDLDNDYPGLVPADISPTNDPADAWLIAYAMCYGWTVVTSEQSDEESETPKIPDVCRSECVPCVSLDDLVLMEGW